MNTKSKGHKDNRNYNQSRLPTYILSKGFWFRFQLLNIIKENKYKIIY